MALRITASRASLIKSKIAWENMDVTNHKRRVQSWFDEALTQGGIERCCDLHVDEISDAWEFPKTWVSAALESFDIARQIRDEAGSIPPLIVVLAFRLQSDSSRIGLTFHNRIQLEGEFCDTPPSLYLFRPGGEFWKQAEQSKQKIDLIVKALDAAEFFGEQYKGIKCVYMEYLWRGREEYSRAVYLAG